MAHEISFTVRMPVVVTAEAEWRDGHACLLNVRSIGWLPTVLEVEEAADADDVLDEIDAALEEVAGPPPADDDDADGASR